MREGMRRLLAAPAVLAGALVCGVLLPPGDAISLGAPRRLLAAQFLVWSFLLGGVIDRYARARPTRAHGFFAACGGHLAAMLRLGVIEAALYLAADNLPSRAAAIALVLAVNAVAAYARVRLVVEDRRSALGSLLAGARFIRRHALAATAQYVLFALPMAAVILAMRRLDLQPPVAELAAAAQILLVLWLFASATVLFQSRLAHATYTAAPPAAWPESPAAEAIANARSASTHDLSRVVP
jgi:hypothetical protein